MKKRANLFVEQEFCFDPCRIRPLIMGKEDAVGLLIDTHLLGKSLKSAQYANISLSCSPLDRPEGGYNEDQDEKNTAPLPALLVMTAEKEAISLCIEI